MPWAHSPNPSLHSLRGEHGLNRTIIDRVGKGVRGAPRDALVADIAPPQLRGAAFGLRQSLDTVGAFVGPLVAVGLMLLWANDFRAVFWVAVIPGLMAVALLVLGAREPVRRQTEAKTNPKFEGIISDDSTPPIGGWWESDRCLHWHGSARPFLSSAPNKGECSLRLSLWLWLQ